MLSFKSYLNEEADIKDTVTLDIPFLIRVLEYAREDAKDDMALHKLVEKLISIRNKGTLTMSDYDFVTKLKEEFVNEDGGMSVGSVGPTNVTGPQSSTDPVSATAVRPNKKKKSMFFVKRNKPTM
jgi:hypothetical protein